MSLQNLLKIGKLAEHKTNADQVGRLLASAGRNIQDSLQESISLESRLDIAYRSIMQVSMIALWANGYRPAKNAPGHHVTMIQSLTHSIELDNNRMVVLDTFRAKRNAIDYTGEDVDESSVEACIAAAEDLIQRLHIWLSENRPDLLP
jgi:hypothetical protein